MRGRRGFENDRLASGSVEMDTSGQNIEKGYHLPWGDEIGGQQVSLTDYGYTGQVKEGGFNFYNDRWLQVREAKWRGFDPAIGKFMQADTIFPTPQGIHSFNQFVYVNSNPLIYSDPSGSSSNDPNSIVSEKEIVLIDSGSLGNIDETAIY